MKMEKLTVNSLRRMLNKSTGYTLIEVMVVLLLIIFVGGITASSFTSMSSEKKAKEFLMLLESDLLYAQQYALSHGDRVEFIIDAQGKRYFLRHNFAPVLVRQFDEEILFERGTLHFHEVVFLANGNIQKSGTILVTINEQLYRIVFLLGRGRFYIEKL